MVHYQPEIESPRRSSVRLLCKDVVDSVKAVTMLCGIVYILHTCQSMYLRYKADVTRDDSPQQLFAENSIIKELEFRVAHETYSIGDLRVLEQQAAGLKQCIDSKIEELGNTSQVIPDGLDPNAQQGR